MLRGGVNRMTDTKVQLGMELRILTNVERQFLGVIKELSGELLDMMSTMGDSREQREAIIRLEEAIMWTTKHIAVHGHANDVEITNTSL